MNQASTIENSLYWQRVVLNASTDPKQRERVKLAIQKLTQELEKIRGEK
jgi:hypothetical protein